MVFFTGLRKKTISEQSGTLMTSTGCCKQQTAASSNGYFDETFRVRGVKFEKREKYALKLLQGSYGGADLSRMMNGEGTKLH